MTAASEDIPHLQLEHARRVDVGEGRNGAGRGAGGDELPDGRVHRGGVAVDGLPAAEVVAMIEQVESLQPQQDGAIDDAEPMLHEGADVLRRRAAEGGLADDSTVDDGAV